LGLSDRHNGEKAALGDGAGVFLQPRSFSLVTARRDQTKVKYTPVTQTQVGRATSNRNTHSALGAIGLIANVGPAHGVIEKFDKGGRAPS
jgi:hypothetical protein